MVCVVPIRAVSFDLFDTLTDLRMEQLPPVEIDGRRAPATTHALHQVLEVRHDVSMERFLGALLDVDERWRRDELPLGIEFPTTKRFAQVLESLGIDDVKSVGTLTEVHMGALDAQASTPDHHPGVLERLRERVALALCSNFSHTPTALAVLERGGLAQFFSQPIVSVDVGIRKPHPEIFQATLEALGVPAADTIHVGDNLGADIAGAEAFGIRSVWITRRVPDLDAALARYEGPPPTWIVDDLADLEAILDADAQS